MHCKLQMAKIQKLVSGGLFTLYFRFNFSFVDVSLFVSNNKQFYQDYDCHYKIENLFSMTRQTSDLKIFTFFELLHFSYPVHVICYLQYVSLSL